MKERFFNWLARLLSKPKVRDWIMDYALKYPYSHIPPFGDVGSYMERYHILPEVWWSPIAIRLHIIRSADTDRHTHSHPFAFRTFIINNGYWETRDEPSEVGDLDGVTRFRAQGTSYSLGRDDAHKIVALGRVSHGAVCTIFVYRKRAPGADWGFKDPVTTRIVPHDYFNDSRKIH